MNKNIEKELKVLVDKKQFTLLCKQYEPLTFIKQINQYYDTNDDAIKKKKGAMRIRTKQGKHIFTLKIQEGKNLLEFECEVKENSLKALNNKEIISLLESYQIRPPFKQTVSLTTHRAVLESEDAQLCFDENFYNQQTDYEIEYEYKKEHDGVKVFNEILSKVNVTYVKNCSSKITRAMNR